MYIINNLVLVYKVLNILCYTIPMYFFFSINPFHACSNCCSYYGHFVELLSFVLRCFLIFHPNPSPLASLTSASERPENMGQSSVWGCWSAQVFTPLNTLFPQHMKQGKHQAHSPRLSDAFVTDSPSYQIYPRTQTMCLEIWPKNALEW